MNKFFKKKFEIIIFDEEKSNAVLELINKKDEYYKFSYDLDNVYNPRKFEDITWELIGFKIESDISEKDISAKLYEFYGELDKLNVNYVLKDIETEEVLKCVDFEYRCEIIVHFTSTYRINNKIIRKFNKIKNFLQIYGIPGFGEDFEKINIIDSTNGQRGFITLTIKLYSQFDDYWDRLGGVIINELEKLDDDFELEIKPVS